MAIEKKRLQRGKRAEPGENPLSPEEATVAREGKIFSIVGKGASAGGLEAIEQFFKKMPPDNGMAFVIVQHLDPSRHSSMPEIMSRLTKMQVNVAADGLRVVPNSIYLIPPDRNMGIKDGALFLEEVKESGALRLPIDFFLRSLAKERGAQGIAIILSGTGTDGTLGLRAIKAEAGTAFVQQPESARYDACLAAPSILVWPTLFYPRRTCLRN
jgi:two-component system CheB/CheR fusion protein